MVADSRFGLSCSYLDWVSDVERLEWLMGIGSNPVALTVYIVLGGGQGEPRMRP